MQNNKPSYEELEKRIESLETENTQLIKLYEDSINELINISHIENEKWKHKEMCRSIFDNAPIGIIYTDEYGTVKVCNRTAMEILGVSEDKLIGFSYLNIRNPKMKAAAIDALLGGTSHFEGEYITVTGNKKLYISANFSPIFSATCSLNGIVGFFEDISMRLLNDNEKEGLLKNLQDALSRFKIITGFLTICSACKRIRDDKGNWNQIEKYIRSYSYAEFSHGMCPECTNNLYPFMNESCGG